MPELRKYQAEALQHLRIAFTNSGHHQVLVAPCGSGKTIIAAQIIKSVIERGKKVIFLTDRIVLAEQTSAKLDGYSIPHGIIQAQHPRWEPHQLCQIVSGSTLIRRKIPDDIALIIQDECHVRSKAVTTLMAYNPDAYFVGLTATPFAKGMAKVWDGVVTVTTATRLTEEKHLVPLRYFAKRAPDLSSVKTVAGEFNQKQLGEATDKTELTADVVQTWLKHGENRQTIAFGVNIAHCKHMMREFNKYNIPTEQIDCYTDTEDRRGMLDRFARGETRILVSVAVLSVGFDETSASCCIMACATKSLIKWHQCSGRVARTHDGKIDAIVFDHGNNAERLGVSTDEYDYILDDGKPRKDGKKDIERKEPLPKACPSCGYIKPAGIRKCPACGLIPEHIASPDFEAGELVELKRARKARKEYTIEQKQAFLAGMNTYARNKGYKMGKGGCFGWCLHAYKDKFGCAPSSKIQWGAVGPITPEVKNWLTHITIAHAANVAKMKGARK